MTGLEWGLLLVVVALVLIVGGLLRTVRRLEDRLDRTSASLDDLVRQTMPLLADTRSALRRADGANRKTDALLDVATSLTNTADSASRLAYKLVSNPIVKVVAFFTGTGRAARRLAEVTSPGSRSARRLARSRAITTQAREVRSARSATQIRARSGDELDTALDSAVDTPALPVGEPPSASATNRRGVGRRRS